MPHQKDQVTKSRPSDGKDFVPMPSTAQTQERGTQSSTERGKDLLNQAKSTANKAYSAVAEKATSSLEEQKVGLSGGLTSVAESIRHAGDSLQKTGNQNYLTEHSANYARTAAEKLEQTAHYFENNDLKAMTRDVESYARRNPAVFLGGAFVLGILVARFLKSSPEAMRGDRGSGSSRYDAEPSTFQTTRSSQTRPA